MGADFMSDEHLVEIVRESFLDTGRQLLRPRDRGVFTPLSRQLRLAA
jgi:hypothetical protein